MGRFTLVLAALVALSACDKKASGGLPPAQEWTSTPGVMAPAQPANPHAGMGANPHAGMGANPHAGMDPHAGMGNPHAGMDPHAGMGNPHGGGDVAQLGLPPPNPDRKIDPNQRVKGTIKVHAKARDRIAVGGAIFVIAKQAGPDGTPVGPPLAVDKLIWQKDGVPFELTEAQAMIDGTKLAGQVIITARYDQDGDALSKQPGDIVGQVKVKVPADGVNLTLDEILP
jgi:hypothetical protein